MSARTVCAAAVALFLLVVVLIVQPANLPFIGGSASLASLPPAHLRTDVSTQPNTVEQTLAVPGTKAPAARSAVRDGSALVDAAAAPDASAVTRRSIGSKITDVKEINPPALFAHRSAEAAKDALTAAAETNFTCPSWKGPKGRSADSQTMLEAMTKYSRYTQQYCNVTGMLQMQMPLDAYVYIMARIGAFVQLRPGMHVFDWGSGCGTMLNYFGLRFNTTGVGIDITGDAVRHAMLHRRSGQNFCLMNGAYLGGFASESFDAVVSWGVLYHIRRTMQQCEIVHHLVRMLRPGGRAFIGHIRTEKTQDYWRKGRCTPPNATVTRHRDAKTFRQPSWKRHDFFSILIFKHGGLKGTEAVAPANKDGEPEQSE